MIAERAIDRFDRRCNERGEYEVPITYAEPKTATGAAFGANVYRNWKAGIVDEPVAYLRVVSHVGGAVVWRWYRQDTGALVATRLICDSG